MAKGAFLPPRWLWICARAAGRRLLSLLRPFSIPVPVPCACVEPWRGGRKGEKYRQMFRPTSGDGNSPSTLPLEKVLTVLLRCASILLLLFFFFFPFFFPLLCVCKPN